MTRYALVDSGDVIAREVDESLLDLSAGVRDGYRWIPINNITNDTSTGPDIVSSDPVETIFTDRVERVRTIRDMTAQETDDEKTSEAADQFDLLKGFALVMMDQINAIHTRMNAADAQAGLGTAKDDYIAAQMKTAIKNRNG